MTPELQSKIAQWRYKASEGTLTEAELKEAIIALRQGRVSAAYASETSRAKRTAAVKVIPSADDLLNELGI